MCGRFTLTVDAHQIREAFPWITVPDEILPRYNIAPSQPIAVIPNNRKDQLDYFIWGLIPSWAKDPSIGIRMINARAETLDTKPSFRASFKRRRCLILADGFYEWQSVPKSKTKIPYYVKMKNNQPFAFAGLWESWYGPDGSNILSCTIITTEPNTLLKNIHNRMPVILPKNTYQLWLQDKEAQPSLMEPLLVAYPTQEMEAYPVSTIVNNPAHETPECILKAANQPSMT
jgi:putative SOS response-associated peptidase YedK